MTNRTGILRNSPLTHAVASVRFAPWANLPNKIAEIQDELRDILPLLNAIQFEQGVPGQHSAAPVAQAWMLMSSDKSHCIQFAPDQLLMFTTRYTRFSDFIAIYRRALSVLLNHMRFVDVINMGVRYVDRITALPTESLSQYITDKWLPPVLANSERVGGAIIGQYKIGSTYLRVNAQSLPNVLPIPNDIIGMTLMAQGQAGEIQLQPTSDKDLILDMDSTGAFSPPERMDLEQVILHLNSLHKIANEFFRNSDTLTDHAFNVWQGEA
ncbi:TIGR04255 family protein [Pseudomonas viridiflava]|uniref:TIGR04255 family protein n=1 Tax=Pseudomonas viridiflava TaxID=33069 RepID=UPI0013C29FF6|nr:TIGR04255 family protein [Pseudomonas viridiflava]